MRCTRCTASASPRHRNVHRSPSTIGTSWRARNRSTAAASGLPLLQPVDREPRLPPVPSWPSGSHDQRVRRQRAVLARSRRTPSSRITQRAGAAPHGQLGHPRGVVDAQPAAGVRQQHRAADPAQPHVGRTRRATARSRRAVVEQQHAVGQRHRPGRPRDDGRAACRRRTAAARAPAPRRARPRRPTPRPPPSTAATARPVPRDGLTLARAATDRRTRRARAPPARGAGRRRAGRRTRRRRGPRRAPGPLPPRRATSRSAPSTPSSCTRCSSCCSASAARCARSARRTPGRGRARPASGRTGPG